jgi:hypothetical protein
MLKIKKKKKKTTEISHKQCIRIDGFIENMESAIEFFINGILIVLRPHMTAFSHSRLYPSLNMKKQVHHPLAQNT